MLYIIEAAKTSFNLLTHGHSDFYSCLNRFSIIMILEHELRSDDESTTVVTEIKIKIEEMAYVRTGS